MLLICICIFRETNFENYNHMKQLQVKDNKSAQRNLTILNSVYNFALNGVKGISEPLEEFVDHYVSKYGRTDKAIDKMVRAQKLKVTTTGFVTGLGGMITLPITIPTDLTSSLYIEMRMVAAIAYLRGYDIHSDEVKTLVYATMAGNAMGDIVKQAGIKVATEVTAKKLLPKLSRNFIIKINKAVGFKLLAKGGTKGIINLGKAIPLVGGIIGGTYNYCEVALYAKWAKRMFNENA